MKAYLDPGCPYGGSFHWYDTIDSTNSHAKTMAAQGAPHGTVVAAAMQTGGRGRMGRTFASPRGSVYLSLILRPDCTPDRLMHLTCAVAVAACDAIEKAAGFRPGVKWINDLVHGGKKLGGILTELSIDPESAKVRYAIIGIGINCNQVPQEVADIADSLQNVCGKEVSPALMTARLLEQLWHMEQRLLGGKPQIMDRYRQDCVTLGKAVNVVGSDIRGIAKDITDDGALLIKLPDGTVQKVSSGEVSVRSAGGYC